MVARLFVSRAFLFPNRPKAAANLKQVNTKNYWNRRNYSK